MLESVCMDERAAADTVTSTAKELSHATLSTSFRSPRILAWEVYGKSGYGTTIKVKTCIHTLEQVTTKS